jgi:hypothetical protein
MKIKLINYYHISIEIINNLGYSINEIYDDNNSYNKYEIFYNNNNNNSIINYLINKKCKLSNQAISYKSLTKNNKILVYLRAILLKNSNTIVFEILN